MEDRNQIIDPAENRSDDSSELSDPGQQLASLTSERDELVRDKADLQDRLLRRQAEFDNFRKRSERERIELFEYASMESVKALLPVLDDFARALNVESTDTEYVKGMELIYQRTLEAMTRLGLEPIESKGKKFDPHLHHAVDRAPTDEVEEDTILDEFQRGYNFKGRLLRPAMVKVAVKP